MKNWVHKICSININAIRNTYNNNNNYASSINNPNTLICLHFHGGLILTRVINQLFHEIGISTFRWKQWKIIININNHNNNNNNYNSHNKAITAVIKRSHYFNYASEINFTSKDSKTSPCARIPWIISTPFLNDPGSIFR